MMYSDCVFFVLSHYRNMNVACNIVVLILYWPHSVFYYFFSLVV